MPTNMLEPAFKCMTQHLVKGVRTCDHFYDLMDQFILSIVDTLFAKTIRIRR